jgi:uncharacterized membrane protein
MIVLLGMIIGSAFATSIEGKILGIELSTLAFLIFTFSIAAGFTMSLRMLRRGGGRARRVSHVCFTMSKRNCHSCRPSGTLAQ